MARRSKQEPKTILPDTPPARPVTHVARGVPSRTTTAAAAPDGAPTIEANLDLSRAHPHNALEALAALLGPEFAFILGAKRPTSK